MTSNSDTFFSTSNLDQQSHSSLPKIELQVQRRYASLCDNALARLRDYLPEKQRRSSPRPEELSRRGE